MSRLLAVYSPVQDVFSHLAMGLVTQNYAGEKGFGIAIDTTDGIKRFSSEGYAINILRPEREKEFADFHGYMGIGHNTSKHDELQPVMISIGGVPAALAVDGTETTSAKIAHMLNGKANLERAVAQVMRKLVDEGEKFALVVLGCGQIVAARSDGRKTLTYGTINSNAHGFYFASQSHILGLDATYEGSVQPGEIAVIKKNNFHRRIIIPEADKTRCIQEVIFAQRQDNSYGNISIAQLRQKTGANLARKVKSEGVIQLDDDTLAIHIPEGGLHPLLGFSEYLQIQFDPGAVIKNKYPLPQFKLDEIWREQIRYSVVKEAVKGKRIILIDDEIRTGDRIRFIAKLCREAGSIEVHGCVIAMTYRSCPHANADYTFKGGVKPRTARSLGLDSLTYLTIEEILDAVKNTRRQYCVDCLCKAK